MSGTRNLFFTDCDYAQAAIDMPDDTELEDWGRFPIIVVAAFVVLIAIVVLFG